MEVLYGRRDTPLKLKLKLHLVHITYSNRVLRHCCKSHPNPPTPGLARISEQYYYGISNYFNHFIFGVELALLCKVPSLLEKVSASCIWTGCLANTAACVTHVQTEININDLQIILNHIQN